MWIHTSTAAATATTAPAVTTPTDPTGSTPMKVTLPADWGAKPVPAMPTPPAGSTWTSCDLHGDGSWECAHA